MVSDLDRPLTGAWESQVPTDVLREDLGKCVCQNPATRWSSGSELARALRNHGYRLQARTLDRQRARQQLRARRFRHAAVLASVVAVLLLAVSAVALYQWREAAHQRDRALAQKRLALDAISQLTHEVPLRLRDIPGALPLARKILSENLDMLDRILDLEPDTPFARRERAANLTSIGDAWLLVGDSAKAMEAFENARQIAEQLADAYPGNLVFLRDLAVAWDRIGDVHMQQGRHAAAWEAFEKSLRPARQDVAERPDNRDALLGLSIGLDKLGSAALKLGRVDEARQAYEESLGIVAKLAAAETDNMTLQRDYAVGLDRLGDRRSSPQTERGVSVCGHRCCGRARRGSY